MHTSGSENGMDFQGQKTLLALVPRLLYNERALDARATGAPV